jgi:hypothetical protein
MVLVLKPPCGSASSYRGDMFGVMHPVVAEGPSLKKPGVDGDTIPGMYALPDVLHGLALVSAIHAARALWCACATTNFFSCCTTRCSLRSAVDSLRRM